MRRFFIWFWGSVTAIGATWKVTIWILDYIGRLQSAKDFFDQREKVGQIMGALLTSHWAPTLVFLIGVVALLALFICPKGAKIVPFKACIDDEGSGRYAFTLGIRNSGDCDATRVKMRTFGWESDMKTDLRIFPFVSGNDIPPNTPLDLRLGFSFTSKNPKPHYVVFAIYYKSWKWGRTVKPKFYYKFLGSKGGKYDPSLYQTTAGERDDIERRFKEEINKAGFKEE
jgi:hypothetical protein